jgi:phosphopantothenoylcysteine decarboxylase / phosphopantothenate---cysteine ligase
MKIARLNILITSGPTSVPIDDMRVITNRSTGEMGRLLAGACRKKGGRVTLLEGAVTTELPLPRGVCQRKFYFFAELEKSLKLELGKGVDIVIHAAAVSDFALKKRFKGKLASHDKVRLELVPTRKLVNGIKKACPRAFLVAFKFEPKLERGYILKKTRALFTEAKCDLVVANSLQKGRYRACIVTPDGKVTRTVSSKSILVKQLISIVGRLTLEDGRRSTSNIQRPSIL